MSAGADDDLVAVIDRLWTVNRERILAKAVALLAALEDAAVGRPVDRAAAAWEAHALAGALGTYGRPGSELFAEVERALGDDAPGMPGMERQAELASCAARVRLAVAEIDPDT